jgi:hypothetical protein
MVHSAAAPAKFRRGDKPVPSGKKRTGASPIAAGSHNRADEQSPRLGKQAGAAACGMGQRISSGWPRFLHSPDQPLPSAVSAYQHLAPCQQAKPDYPLPFPVRSVRQHSAHSDPGSLPVNNEPAPNKDRCAYPEAVFLRISNRCRSARRSADPPSTTKAVFIAPEQS